MGRLPSRPTWRTFSRVRTGLAVPMGTRTARPRHVPVELVPMSTIVELVRAGRLIDLGRKFGGGV